MGVKIGLDLDDAIDKPVLRGVSKRLCFIERGLGEESVAIDFQDFGDGFPALKKFVPDV